MKTEDNFNIYSDNTYWIVYYKNHSVFIGTSQERELFKTYKAVIHCGVESINTFGTKLFKLKKNAKKWIKENNTIINSICSVDGCKKNTYLYGYCEDHVSDKIY